MCLSDQDGVVWTTQGSGHDSEYDDRAKSWESWPASPALRPGIATGRQNRAESQSGSSRSGSDRAMLRCTCAQSDKGGVENGGPNGHR